MDLGHHNCRDYHIEPDPAKRAQPVSTASILAARAARASQQSPLNGPSRKAPAFPFLKLPLELRRHIYSYLLPRTEEQRDARPFFQTIISKRVPPTHTNFPAGVLPNFAPAVAGKENTIWYRGQTCLLAVSRQLHDECAELLYGESTFVIFVTYDSISFRFRFSANGLSPSKTFEFLELIPPKYLKLIKRLTVTVDHVDSYTGQIKYNVGGKGLTYGLRCQVANLVRSLQAAVEGEDGKADQIGRNKYVNGIKWLSVKLSNGNDHLDTEKRNMVKAKGEDSIHGVEQVQTVLEPLMDLKGLVSLDVTGAVTEDFVERLKKEILKKG